MKSKYFIFLLISLSTIPGSPGWSQVYPPDTKLAKTQIDSSAMPAYLTPVKSSLFGTYTVRIADQNTFGSTAQQLGHVYTKQQYWNSDGTYLMLNATSPGQLLDGKTYKFIKTIHQPSQATFSNTDPDIIYGINPDTNEFVKFSIKNNARTILHKFTEYDKIDMGAWEGCLSNDDAYIAGFGFKGNQTEIFIYDLKQDKVISRLDCGTQTAGAFKGADINNCIISQSGNFLVVQYGTDKRGQPAGIEVYDKNCTYLRRLNDNASGHFDLGYDTNGNEVLVNMDDNKNIVAIRLDNGGITKILDKSFMGWPIHVSCRNINRPGWVYISSFYASYGEPSLPYYQKIFALKIDGSETVQIFAHAHHSTTADYDREVQAVPNRDGTVVLFRSDWEDNSSSAPIYAYVAYMPQVTRE